MTLSREEIELLAYRSRLKLNEEEIKKYVEDIRALEAMSSALLPYFGSLGDVEGEPMGLSDLRADSVKPCLPRESLLELSSLRENDCISVPGAVKEA